MKYLILLLILIHGCGSAKENKIKALKNEVIGIHDEIMPKMGDLRKVRKNLILMADSLTNIDSVEALMVTKMANDIANINEDMMNWMRNYEPGYEGGEDVWQYFQDQKKSIQQIKENMEKSLAKGKGFLE